MYQVARRYTAFVRLHKALSPIALAEGKRLPAIPAPVKRASSMFGGLFGGSKPKGSDKAEVAARSKAFADLLTFVCKTPSLRTAKPTIDFVRPSIAEHV